jgi:hypothetical protein
MILGNDLLTILWCNRNCRCFIEALRNYPTLFGLRLWITPEALFLS